MATAGPTIVLGLNAALQKRLVIDSPLVPGSVHRASSVDIGIGGKGQDVAIALSCLDFQRMQLAQYIGTGAEGDLVAEQLVDRLGPSALDLTVRPASHLRTCTSLVANDSTTELVEPSGVITEEEQQLLLDKLQGIRASAVCIMGSLPPGCPPSTYGDLYRSIASRSTLCLIDSVIGLAPLIQAVAEIKGPCLLKCNAAELCRLGNVQKSAAEAGGAKVGELVAAVQGFLRAHPHAADALSAIAITDGAHPAHLASLPVAAETEFRLFQLPVVTIVGGEEDEPEKEPATAWGQWTGSRDNLQTPAAAKSAQKAVVYPIGAGDAVAAGTLAAWKSLHGDTKVVHPDIAKALEGNERPITRMILAAFGFGLACGTASCLQRENSVIDIADAIEFYQQQGRPIFLSSHKV